MQLALSGPYVVVVVSPVVVVIFFCRCPHLSSACCRCRAWSGLICCYCRALLLLSHVCQHFYYFLLFISDTRKTRHMGKGLAGVQISVPEPVPLCTPHKNPHGFPNPWHSLPIVAWHSSENLWESVGSITSTSPVCINSPGSEKNHVVIGFHIKSEFIF